MSIGTALLVKEFALFFFPLSFIATAINRRGEGWLDTWRGWIITSFISFIISFWWYLFFGGAFYISFGEALTGTFRREYLWHFPWWYYFKNIPFDLSYLITAFFIVGIIFVIRETLKERLLLRYNLFIIWIVLYYLLFSLFIIKTPWYIYLATPPMAVIAAIGINRLTERLHSLIANIVIFAIIFLQLFITIFIYNHGGYLENVTGFYMSLADKKRVEEIHGNSWKEMTKMKERFGREMKGVGKVAFLSFNPLWQYLMGIEKDKVVIVKVSRFMSLDRDELSEFASNNGIGAFVLSEESLTYTEKNLQDMFDLWGEPQRFGHLLVFKTGRGNG